MVMFMFPPFGDAIRFYGNVGAINAGKEITASYWDTGWLDWRPVCDPLEGVNPSIVEPTGDYVIPDNPVDYIHCIALGQFGLPKEQLFRLEIDGVPVDEQQWDVDWEPEACVNPPWPDWDCWAHLWDLGVAPQPKWLHGPWNRSYPPNTELIRFYGVIRPNLTVKIEKEEGGAWLEVGNTTSAPDGSYNIPIEFYLNIEGVPGRVDTYRLFVDGDKVEEALIDTEWVFEDYYQGDIPKYSCEWSRTFKAGTELIRFYGRIDPNSTIKIEKKEAGAWLEVGNDTTGSNGLYYIPTEFYFNIEGDPGRIDTYRFFVNTNKIAEVPIPAWTFEGYYQGDIPKYAYKWNWIPSNLLIKVNRIEEITSQRINRVKVYGLSEDGGILKKIKETDGVISGEDKPIEYVYSNDNLSTQSEVNNMADDLFLLYSDKTIWRFEAEFKLRTDLQLLQKIKFVGFADIPEENMRITKIEYIRKTADVHVKIGFIPDQPLTSVREESGDPVLPGVTTDYADIEVGTVVSVDTTTATVDLEKGGTVQARILI